MCSIISAMRRHISIWSVTLRTDLCPQSHLRPLDSEMAFFPLENSALKASLFKYILNLTEGSKHTVRLYNTQSNNCGHVYTVLVPTCPESIGSLGQHLSYFLCASEFPVLDSVPRVTVLITICIGQNWQGFSSWGLQGWPAGGGPGLALCQSWLLQPALKLL